jgi:very-short-patch-repair endonuclease
MTGSFRGASVIVLSALFLGGCFAPMTTREAQSIANQRLTKFCNGRCGAVKMARTQKIANRWLVDFDAPRQKFTVTVEDDGNSHVDIWSK